MSLPQKRMFFKEGRSQKIIMGAPLVKYWQKIVKNRMLDPINI
jgi:hypothetical protein